ncbi:hypothetical protein Daus18300_011208 [Diaporthe australafricana]|uniref:Uncharacterized protein n=1 Tax=Diaporthe australafricana TaxID=127596 RepID=A0ABR3W7J9_9PEZI
MANIIRKLTQTGNSHDQPDLETLRDNLPIFIADEPEQIVDAFETGLDSLSQPSSSVSVQEAAQTLLAEIQRILPLTVDKKEQAFLLESLASLLMCTAQQTPSRHIGQELLVNTVGLINVSPEETWRNGFLMALGMRMRDGWSGFTMENGEEEDDVQTPDEWLNLNSFNARLFGSGITRWYNMAIWQLREALETKLGPDSHENDCKIAVASEWIIQAGPQLLRETMLNEDISEAENRAYSGLELWTGMPGLSTERWGFWKRRLAEVKLGVKTKLTLDYLEHAERVMTAVEKDLASSIPRIM